MNQLLSTKGQTLLSVVMGMGIMAITALGTATVMSHFANSMKSSMRDASIEAAMAQIIAAFGRDEKYCTSILAGRVDFDLSNTAGEIVEEISFYNHVGKKQANILRSDEIYNNTGLKIAEIRLLPIGRISQQTALAELAIKFDKGSGGILGGPLTTRRIPLYIGFNAGQIVFCSTSIFGIYTIPQRICQHQGWGFSRFDPMHRYILPSPQTGTKACDDIEDVEWVLGATSEEAMCGSGRKLAVPKRFRKKQSLPSSGLCKTSRTGTINLPPRRYVTSAGVFSVHDHPVSVGKAKAIPQTDSCKFEHAVTIAGSPIESYVRCVPQ